MNQNIVYLGQLNLKEIIREIEEEKVVRMLKIITENNTKILKLQSILMILIKINEEEARR